MKNGLRYLAPNQKLPFFLTNVADEDVYLIDFSQLLGLHQLGEPPLYKIAKSIENIQKDIHNLSTEFCRRLERDDRLREDDKE
jgi:hypothetical protein